MTRHVTFAVPGDLATPTGGYAYDRRVIAELRELGWHVDVCNLGDGFPKPTAATLRDAHAMLTQAPTSAPLVIDGLAFGVMDASAAILARTHRIVALVHHPLALETGLSGAETAVLRRSERAALAQARRTIVTSPQTAEILAASYDVAPNTIVVALPGHDLTPAGVRERGSPVRLLTVGSIVPRKGYEVLVAALAELADLSWRLDIVGDDTRSPQTAAALRDFIAARGLSRRVTLRGALSANDLAQAYHHADIYVTASHFEGYGMAAAEAIACGLPVVATAGGALAQTIGDAGLMVPPNDSAALAAAMRQMIDDPNVWASHHRASLATAKKLPHWRDTAKEFARALEGVP